MAHVDSIETVRNIMWLVNTPSKHETSTLPANTRTSAGLMLANSLRCWPSIKPALFLCLMFTELRSIADGLVVLTAGGNYKPTLTQCLLNVGPGSQMLAGILSSLVYFMLTGARAHSTWGAAADSKMEVSAYFTSVHIPSFEKAVRGNAADSKMEVSYFTSVHIYRLLEGLQQVLLQTVTQAKRKYILDLQVSTYGLLATLLHS